MLYTGKLLNRRGSQFLILPPEIKFDGREVRLSRLGDSVLIEAPDKSASPRIPARRAK